MGRALLDIFPPPKEKNLFNERARQVLSQVVHLHYQTCEPVGSASICHTRSLRVSSATVRNIMLNLEQQGYLEQPHTSAGRLPTDLGYRAYVDGMSLACEELGEEEKQQLNARLEGAPRGPGQLKAVADHIQKRTGLPAFHIPFRQFGMRLKHLHFQRINTQRVMVIWVTHGGVPFQSMLEIDEGEMNNLVLEKTENYLNAAFQGCNLQEMQDKLTRNLLMTDDQWHLILAKATRIARGLADDAEELDDLSFQGTNSLFGVPEFQNVRRLKAVFDLFEAPDRLKGLVRLAMADPKRWILFLIGGELRDPSLESLSIVLAKFRTEQNWLGCVGVVGPRRLPYQTSFQILSHAREQIAKLAS